jgi:hypothetical protein
MFRGVHLVQSQMLQGGSYQQLAAINKVKDRECGKIACGNGIEECNGRSARDAVKLSAVVGGSE